MKRTRGCAGGGRWSQGCGRTWPRRKRGWGAPQGAERLDRRAPAFVRRAIGAAAGETAAERARAGWAAASAASPRLTVCGAAVDPAARELLRTLRPGSGARQIPQSIVQEFRLASRWAAPAPAAASANGVVAALPVEAPA